MANASGKGGGERDDATVIMKARTKWFPGLGNCETRHDGTRAIAVMREDASESLAVGVIGNRNGSRYLWACVADNEGDGGRSASGGASHGGASLPASARLVPAACSGGTMSATHH